MPNDPDMASWQTDPLGRAQWRYWDGTRWTDETSDDAVHPVDAPQADARPSKARRSGWRLFFITAAVAIVVSGIAAVVGLLVNSGNDSSHRSAQAAAHPTQRTKPVATTTTFPEPDVGRPCAPASEGQTDAAASALLPIECVRVSTDPASGFTWYLQNIVRQSLDYTITADGCTADIIQDVTCTGTITNLRKAPQTYVVTLDYLDLSGVRLSEEFDIINELAPGAPAQWSVSSIITGVSDVHPKIVSVRGSL